LPIKLHVVERDTQKATDYSAKDARRQSTQWGDQPDTIAGTKHGRVGWPRFHTRASKRTGYGPHINECSDSKEKYTLHLTIWGVQPRQRRSPLALKLVEQQRAKARSEYVGEMIEVVQPEVAAE
jgi:hypothetical protein